MYIFFDVWKINISVQKIAKNDDFVKESNNLHTKPIIYISREEILL